MRKSLGSVLLLVLFYSSLFGSEYKWSVASSSKEVFVNEAIYLKYVCQFSNRAELYTVEFDPVTENEIYKIEHLSETTKLEDGKRINIYEYVAFVKKPMLMNFRFNALMKKTTKGSIENTVLGRDNAEKEQFTIQTIQQESIEVQVNQIPTDLSGKFTLEVKKDETQKKAYEPFHLDITLSGNGNFSAMKALEYHLEGGKVFAQNPIENIHLYSDGYKGTWSQKFAFISAKDFILPAKDIEYFDIESKSVKILHIDAIEVKVQEAYKMSELLDKEEEVFSLDIQYLYYLLTFIAGFLVAKIKFKVKAINTKTTQLRDKIQDAKSMDALSMILILNNHRKFNDILASIDTKELTSLTQAKNQAIKLLMDK